MLGAVALFTACSDDGGSGSGNINYEEGYKYLTNLNVSDAKMIYQKSSATRATGDDSYYKLDLSGNEVKLSIKGEDGQDHNIGIHKVLKLSDIWGIERSGFFNGREKWAKGFENQRV